MNEKDTTTKATTPQAESTAPAGLTAELAAKIMQADLANIARKVKAGRPLTQGERRLIAEEAGKAPKASEKDLAARWGTVRRTVRRWKKQGAPLGDDAAMRTWLSGRAKLPPGTTAILSGASSPTPTSATAPPSPQQGPPEPKPRPIPGAAAALRRMEDSEVLCFQDLEAALPTGDLARIKFCRDAYLKTAEALRRADLAIEEDRRERGALLPRKELEDYAQGFIVHFVGGVQAALEIAMPRLHGLATIQATSEAILGAFRQGLGEAVEHTAARPFAGRVCPKWLNEAIEAAIQTYL
jgi:hypothetical protein